VTPMCIVFDEVCVCVRVCVCVCVCVCVRLSKAKDHEAADQQEEVTTGSA